MTRASTVRAGLATRARIVLLAANAVANTDIADQTGTSRPTVLKWRGRYSASGVDGLDDDPRQGRAAVIDEVAVLAETLADKGKPPAHLGVTHWSARLMAARLGISFASVARIWRKWDSQPHRIETFKFSTETRGSYRKRLDRPRSALQDDAATQLQQPVTWPDRWLNAASARVTSGPRLRAASGVEVYVLAPPPSTTACSCTSPCA